MRGVASPVLPGKAVTSDGASPGARTSTAPLDAIFRARSVAVVGASSDPDCVGRQILDSLLDFGYPGRVFAVNPKRTEIRGVPCYPSVRAIKEPLDLALLVVPRLAVLPVVEDCLAKGVGGLVVVSGGFREFDVEGAHLEALLRQQVAEAGVPLLGPNCMGLVNADPAVQLNLTFSPVPPRSGHVAFLSQSGALGALVLTLADSLGLGFSLFASLGNEAGITHREALEYAAADPLTRVIVLYLETFDDPQAFLRVARQVSRQKPVVCLKSGRTETGAHAARSHTGALATGARVTEAVLRQSGVIPVETTEEMLNVALAFAHAPLPRGSRVRILTNAGGPGVLAADALGRRGLDLPPLDSEKQSELRAVVTPQAPLANPVDLTVEGTPWMYGQAARLLLDDPGTDSLLGIFVVPPRVSGHLVLTALSEAASLTDKPVVLAFPAQGELHREHLGGNFALLDTPEIAATALAALTDYATRQARPVGKIRSFPVARPRIEKLLHRAQRRGRTALDLEESLGALRAYGIAVASYAFARTLDQVGAGAARVGFPLALKVVSSEILHKTEVGGVVLGITSASALRKEYCALLRRLRAAGLDAALRGVVLQRMTVTKREMVLGFRRDEQGTPLLLAGWGGILVEALEAAALRVLPVTDQDVRELLNDIPGARALGAFRGLGPVARPALEETLLRLAQLASDFPAIREIDINPFVVASDPAACLALDARILLAA